MKLIIKSSSRYPASAVNWLVKFAASYVRTVAEQEHWAHELDAYPLQSHRSLPRQPQHQDPMMTPPTLHLNGTHPDDLREGFVDAFRAVNDAMDTLRKSAAPNGRDYYPQGNAALDQAIREHVARLERLGSVADELLALAIHVQEKQPSTGPLARRP